MIFLDYNAPIDHNGGNHVGARVIWGSGNVAIVLHPGAQGIEQEAWDRVKDHPSIGWKDGEYSGVLMTDGMIRILPTKGKDVDWSKVPRASLTGEDGLIRRTVQPRMLDSMRLYAAERAARDESWSKVVTAIEKHLGDVCTGFDGKQIDVATAQSRFKQAIGM